MNALREADRDEGLASHATSTEHGRVRLTTSTLAGSLREAWGLAALSIEPHDAGMNSRTWFVTEGGDRYVAKAVPDTARRRFASGLAVAELVNAAGIPAGVPIPTREGRAYVELVGHTVALLEFVEGKPLRGDNKWEQQTIGDTLPERTLPPPVKRYQGKSVSTGSMPVRRTLAFATGCDRPSSRPSPTGRIFLRPR